MNLVTEDRIARDDFQAGQLREAVDEIFGYAVSHEFRVWLAANVNERQDGQRVYGVAPSFSPDGKFVSCIIPAESVTPKQDSAIAWLKAFRDPEVWAGNRCNLPGSLFPATPNG